MRSTTPDPGLRYAQTPASERSEDPDRTQNTSSLPKGRLLLPPLDRRQQHPRGDRQPRVQRPARLRVDLQRELLHERVAVLAVAARRAAEQREVVALRLDELHDSAQQPPEDRHRRAALL